MVSGSTSVKVSFHCFILSVNVLVESLDLCTHLQCFSGCITSSCLLKMLTLPKSSPRSSLPCCWRYSSPCRLRDGGARDSWHQGVSHAGKSNKRADRCDCEGKAAEGLHLRDRCSWMGRYNDTNHVTSQPSYSHSIHFIKSTSISSETRKLCKVRIYIFWIFVCLHILFCFSYAEHSL